MSNKITVKIAGNNATLKFTMHSIMVMIAMSKKNTDPDLVTGYDSIIAMVWGGLHGWWRLVDKDPDITLEQVSDFVEESEINESSVLNEIAKCFEQSSAYHKLQKAAETVTEESDDAKKKDSTQTSSEPLPLDALA